jgi:hypothetical protein
MLFPFGFGCNFAETGDSTNGGRFPEGCTDRVSLGGDQELSSFIRMKLAKELFQQSRNQQTVAARALNRVAP